MRQSEKFAVPPEAALVYDFLNSLDQRRYLEQRTQHTGSDEIATPSHLEEWLRPRGLLGSRQALNDEDHRKALGLRDALRGFVRLKSEDGAEDLDMAARLTAASADFPLVLTVAPTPAATTLNPAVGAAVGGLGRVLAQLHALSEADKLHRLKMCGSADCQWVFYDRSKPANRRWCSSSLCGNRQKTRAYRHRQRASARKD